MIIRTGILSIPDWDERAILEVRNLLRSHLPGAVIVEETFAQSQRNWIEEILRRWADEEEIGLIVTIGGTLPAPSTSGREVVPDATFAVLDTCLPALPETMRAYAAEQTELALLDRSMAGIRGRTLIINLPSGAAATHLFLEGILSIIAPILSHLHERPDAPQIDQDLEIIEDSDLNQPFLQQNDQQDTQPDIIKTTGSSPVKKGLDPAEFAEFLKRSKS
ncbi:MAG: hypothetical protein AAF702_20400 [Chloroflexota bacterium]